MSRLPLRLVVGSGPTREWLDPVRFLTNASTGRTGWNLARHGLARFEEVIFISGPADPRFVHVEGARNVEVDTTEEMARAVQAEISDDTLLIMAAAPADYTPADPGAQKIKKESGVDLVLRLHPTTDILKSIIPLARGRRGLFRAGFAAETTDTETYARRKLAEKDLDFICANRVYKTTCGFGDNDNSLLVIDRSGKATMVGPQNKEKLAALLLDHLISQISVTSARETL